jgi:hypothetical protein
MCKLFGRNCTCDPQRPAWMEKTREETCDDEIDAAETHISYYVEALKSGYSLGTPEWHSRFYYAHMNAAFFTCPERFRERVGEPLPSIDEVANI